MIKTDKTVLAAAQAVIAAQERVEAVRKATDPVHFEPAGSWYFWDETWADRVGPFPDEVTARRELARYADSLDGKVNGEERRVPRPTEPRAYKLGDKVIIPALSVIGEVTHLGRDPSKDVMVAYPERRYPGTSTAQWFKTEELQPAPVAAAEERPGCGCGHASDCAVHNEPAMPAGECDCGETHRVSMDRYGFKDADELNWLDIGGEAERAYVYRDGFTFKVTEPLQLAVKRGERGDSHRIRTKDGHGIYIAPGWVAIVWKMRGERASAF